MLIGALYGRSVDKRDGEIPLYSVPIDEEDTINYYGGILKIVQPIGGSMAFGFDLTAQRINTTSKDNTEGESEETSDTNVEGMLAFYPVAQFGIGATLEIQRGDTIGSEGNTYGIAAIFFPMPNVGIMFSYNRFKPANDVDDKNYKILESNSFDVSVRARF